MFFIVSPSLLIRKVNFTKANAQTESFPISIPYPLPSIVLADSPRKTAEVEAATRRATLECPGFEPLVITVDGGANGDWYADGKAQS